MAIPAEKEDRHRLLIEILSHGVQENDCDGVITYSNQAHHLILGCEPGELVGKRIWDFQPSAAEKESLKNYFFNLVNEQPIPVAFQTTNRRKDGALVSLQVDWNYERNADGTLKGFISIITNITDRKKAEESLRQRTQGLATLLEVSRSLAESLDMQRVLQATVDGVTKLVGLDTAAVYLLEDQMLHLWATTPPLPPQFPDQLRFARLVDHPHIRRAITSGEPVYIADYTAADLTPAERSVVELRNLRTVLFLPLIADEKTMGAFIVGSVQTPSHLSDAEIDLSLTLANLAALAVRNSQLYKEGGNYAVQLEKTLAERIRAEEERKHLEAQLIQAQKVEAIGRLAGGIAHDFNNLLVPIINYAEMGMMKLSPDQNLYNYLKRISEAAGRAADLTRQILAFSRKQVLDMKQTDVNELIADFIEMIRRMIGEDVELQTALASSLLLIMADKGQIEQILMNLVVNARDAMPEGGTLTIETGGIFLDEKYAEKHVGVKPGPYVMIAVSDTGHGMNAETQQHIFEPFFSTKEQGKGTGLGLATVFGIVKQHRGNILVYSEPGKGTTFKIYLPLIIETKQLDDSQKVSEPISLHGTETVLVVEDESMVRNFVCESLESYGYEVLMAGSPYEGLHRVEAHQNPIHLLLTDVIMPQMNGRELYQKVIQTRPDIKVLFMSGYTDDVILQQGLSEVSKNFLQKPFTISNLMEKVRTALS